MRGVLHTSVFIADEQGRALRTDLLPDDGAVCVVTLAELELGVHLADSAEIRASARREGRRPKVQDTSIAAAARAHGAAVYTQDGDFDDLPGVEVVRV